MPIDQVEQLHKQAKEAIAHGDYRASAATLSANARARSDSPDIHYGMATVAFLPLIRHAADHFKDAAASIRRAAPHLAA